MGKRGSIESLATSGSTATSPGKVLYKKLVGAASKGIIGLLVLIFVGWTVVVTLFLTGMSLRYLGATVDRTRQMYGVEGSATWAIEEASRSLATALEARRAVRTALCRGHVGGPWDTAAFERVLTPYVVSRAHALRSVELSFSDRSSTLVVGRSRGSDGEWLAQLQSDAWDCFMLGLEGCIGRPGAKPPWYADGMALKEGGVMGDMDCPGITNTTHEEAQSWAFQPELLRQPVDDDGFDGDIRQYNAWFPSYRLLFRTSFAFNEAHGQAPIAVVGRATVELGELSGERLEDKQLGSDGLVYLVDEGGWVLSSQKPQELLEVRKQGVLRFRRIWELDTPWASAVRAAFPPPGRDSEGVKELAAFVGQTKLLGLTSQATFVAVNPLPEPYKRFAVVVIVPSQNPFTYVWLWRVSIGSFFSAAFPYEAFVVGAIGLFIHQWLLFFRDQASSPLRGSHVAGMEYGQGNHAYGKTGFRQSVANMSEGVFSRMRGSVMQTAGRMSMAAGKQ